MKTLQTNSLALNNKANTLKLLTGAFKAMKGIDRETNKLSDFVAKLAFTPTGEINLDWSKCKSPFKKDGKTINPDSESTATPEEWNEFLIPHAINYVLANSSKTIRQVYGRFLNGEKLDKNKENIKFSENSKKLICAFDVPKKIRQEANSKLGKVSSKLKEMQVEKVKTPKTLQERINEKLSQIRKMVSDADEKAIKELPKEIRTFFLPSE